MPNFLKLFATDNQCMRTFVTLYLELLRTNSGLSQLDHEMIALVAQQRTDAVTAAPITAR